MESILHIFGIIMLVLAFSISCYNAGYKNGVDDAYDGIFEAESEVNKDGQPV